MQKVAERRLIPPAPPNLKAAFPAIHPPPDTPFQCYAFAKDAEKDADKDFVDRKTMVGGEADTVDFLTATQIDREEVGCRCVASYHISETFAENTYYARLATMSRCTTSAQKLRLSARPLCTCSDEKSKP